MKLRFFDENMRPLADVKVSAEDHWQACQIGFELLEEGRVAMAEDFSVLEESTAEHSDEEPKSFNIDHSLTRSFKLAA